MPRSIGMIIVTVALSAFTVLAPVSAFAVSVGGHGGGGGHFGGGGGAHFGGGHFAGHWGSAGHYGHWVGPGRFGYYPAEIGFGIPFPYFFGPDFYLEPGFIGPYGPSCARVRRHVHTSHGWRWRLVTVCR